MAVEENVGVESGGDVVAARQVDEEVVHVLAADRQAGECAFAEHASLGLGRLDGVVGFEAVRLALARQALARGDVAALAQGARLVARAGGLPGQADAEIRVTGLIDGAVAVAYAARHAAVVEHAGEGVEIAGHAVGAVGVGGAVGAAIDEAGLGGQAEQCRALPGAARDAGSRRQVAQLAFGAVAVFDAAQIDLADAIDRVASLAARQARALDAEGDLERRAAQALDAKLSSSALVVEGAVVAKSLAEDAARRVAVAALLESALPVACAWFALAIRAADESAMVRAQRFAVFPSFTGGCARGRVGVGGVRRAFGAGAKMRERDQEAERDDRQRGACGRGHSQPSQRSMSEKSPPGQVTESTSQRASSRLSARRASRTRTPNR